MKREDYTAAVLWGLRHVTEKEKEALRRELDGHMEDHMLALLELGYDETAAEKKAADAMGDPAETARELQKCYSFGWLVAGYVMEAVLVLLLIACIAGSILVGRLVCSSARVRLDPMSHLTAEQRENAHELDIQVDCGGSVVEFFAIRLTAPDQVDVYTCTYSAHQLGRAAGNLAIDYFLPGERETTLCMGGGGESNAYVRYWRARLTVPEGTERVVAVISWLGEERTVELPLDWEAAA